MPVATARASACQEVPRIRFVIVYQWLAKPLAILIPAIRKYELIVADDGSI